MSHRFMRFALKVYTNSWMFFSSIMGFFGFYMLLKAIMGSLFPNFVYGYYANTYGTNTTAVNDFQYGVVLLVLAAIIFGIHLAIDYFVDARTGARGGLADKLFISLGIVYHGLVFWGAVVVVAFELISYSQQYGAKPGATIATIIPAGIIWGYYMLRGFMLLGPNTAVKKRK